MHKKNVQSIATAIVALALGASSLSAVAQPSHRGESQAHREGAPSAHSHKGPQHAHQPARPTGSSHRPGAQNHKQVHNPGHPHGMPPGQAKRMGAGPQHNWVKGSRVPSQYRSRHYVVSDWHGHGLKRPPRGYQWVQYGGDYLLIAVATGVIAQLILGY